MRENANPSSHLDLLAVASSRLARCADGVDHTIVLLETLMSGLHMSEAERRTAEAILRVLSTQARMAVSAARTIAKLGHEHSERPAADETLKQGGGEGATADRLTILGELATSVVHEVNNPLTAILASAEAALRWLDDPWRDIERARASIARILKEARRTHSIVEGLKRLAQSGDLALEVVEIGALVGEVIVDIEAEIQAADVTLSLDESAGATALRADKVQLQQVLLNLIRNATEAMSGTPVEERSLAIWIRREGDELLIGISDRGRGAPTDDLEQMFGPLFTTKHRGMGVGLALARRVAAAHDGRLTASRNPEGGLTFTLALPV